MFGHDRTPSQLLTVGEVAEWLNVSKSLVYQLVESGMIAVHRVGNGRGAVRFSKQDVEEYLVRCRKSRRVSKDPGKTVFPSLKHIRLEDQGTSEAVE